MLNITKKHLFGDQIGIIENRNEDIFISDSAERRRYFLVDFDGGSGLEFRNEFLSLSDIRMDSAGFSEEEQAYIIASLNELCADDNVVFAISLPEDMGNRSIIYVGSTDAFDGYGTFPGIAETIGNGNRIANDNAYVLTDNITGGIEQVISVIAHEAGHLLGESHANPAGDIHDYAAPYEFVVSPGAAWMITVDRPVGETRLVFSAASGYGDNALTIQKAVLAAPVGGTVYVFPDIQQIRIGGNAGGGDVDASAVAGIRFSSQTRQITIGSSILNTVYVEVNGSVHPSLTVTNYAKIKTLYGGQGIGDEAGFILAGGEVATAFGGGSGASDIGTVNLHVTGGTHGTVYLGGDGSSGNARVGVTQAVCYWVSGQAVTLSGCLFGGGRGAGSTVWNEAAYDVSEADSYMAGTSINISTGTYGNVFGGGDDGAVVEKNTLVRFSYAKAGGSVYGGGRNGAIIGGDTYVIVSGVSGSYAGVGSIYGGGSNATVDGNAKIGLYNTGTFETIVYGGGEGTADLVKGGTSLIIGASADGSTTIVGKVFGGGRNGATVGGDTYVYTYRNSNIIGELYLGGDAATVKGGTRFDQEVGTHLSGTAVYGGGYNGAVHGGTALSLKGAVTGTVYGGGNGSAANVGKGTNVFLNGGTMNGDVYGGGADGAAVNGGTLVSASLASVAGTVYGGGRDGAAVNGGTVVRVRAGNIGGDIYGGGNHAKVTGSTLLDLGGAIVMPDTVSFHGGGRNGEVDGKAVVSLGNIAQLKADVYGGGNGAGALVGSGTELSVAGTAVSGDIYGGGRNGATVNGGTQIAVSAADIRGNVYGGGRDGAAVNGGTQILLQSGTLSGSFYGGGNAADVQGNTFVSAYWAIMSGAFYGGGNNGTVTGNASVEITAGVSGNWGGFEGEIYGGGNNGGVTGDTAVTLGHGDYLGNIYGGGNGAGGTVGGGTLVQLSGGTPKVTGDIYGGGNGGAAVTGSAAVGLSNGNAVIAGDVYGGGRNSVVSGGTMVNAAGGTAGGIHGGGSGSAASVMNGAEVKVGGNLRASAVFGGGAAGAVVEGGAKVTIAGGTPTADIYGGGNAADVRGDTVVSANWTQLAGSVYGGGRNGDVTGNAEVWILAGDSGNWGGVTGDVYGGGNGGAVAGRTEITLGHGDYLGNIFGGGTGAGGTVGSGTLFHFTSDGTVRISGHIYGGGDNGAVVSNGAVVDLNNKNAVVNGDVYGGGRNAAVDGGTTVRISGGTVTNVYGGGRGGQVNGDAVLLIAGGNITGEAFAGGSGGLVTGNTRLVLNTSVDGDIYGGGKNGNVAGNAAVEVNANFRGDIYGGGCSGAVFGRIVITIAAGCDAAGAFIYAGGTGDVNTATKTGDAITVNINSAVCNQAYNIVLGTCNDASSAGNATVYGDVVLNLQNNGAGAGASSGRIYVGGYRTAAGTTTVTGKATLTIGSVRMSDILFAGGYASGTGAAVVVEGGSELILAGTVNTGFTMLGGWATGSGARSMIGTAENLAGVALTVSGASRLGTITGGGYGVNGGESAVYGNSVITIASTARTGLVYGGGYALGGIAINYGKGLITVTGSADTNFIYGGGYAGANGYSRLTGGTEIQLDGFNRSSVGIFGGGRSTSNGTAVVGTSGMTGKGVTITIDRESSVGTVLGGGHSVGSGSNVVYGGTRIIVNGGSTGFIYGGGYSASSGAGALIYGDTEIIIDGGTVGSVFGAGNADSATGAHAVIYGNTNITVDCSAGAVRCKSIFGGGHGLATVTGDTCITIKGLGDNLTFAAGSFIGGGAPTGQGGGIGGTRFLNLTDFTGTITANFAYFDVVTISGSRVHWSTGQGSYMVGVNTWNFKLAEGETALTWDAGNGGFSGDTFNLDFDTAGFNAATVIAGGSASVIGGWNNSGNTVYFNGVAGEWDLGLNAWVDANRQWKFGLAENNTLSVSKV